MPIQYIFTHFGCVYFVHAFARTWSLHPPKRFLETYHVFPHWNHWPCWARPWKLCQVYSSHNFLRQRPGLTPYCQDNIKTPGLSLLISHHLYHVTILMPFNLQSHISLRWILIFFGALLLQEWNCVTQHMDQRPLLATTAGTFSSHCLHRHYLNVHVPDPHKASLPKAL